ncbi:MAG: electron transfer flavoprotein subunit alpha/FixB family protein [Cryomorphaceae bacterium]|nr:electron transfer flavoprotein subunit alpha/FixB family protein [Flavobacteriales bacterium]
MSVLVFVETHEGKIAKAAYEAVYYGKLIAEKTSGTVTAVTYGDASEGDLEKLGNYGAKKVLVNKNIKVANDQSLTDLAQQAVEAEGAKIVVFAFDVVGKSVAPRLSARLKAGLVPGAIDVPEIDGDNFVVTKNVFSGKAFAKYSIKTEIKIIALLPNSFKAETSDETASVETFENGVAESKITLKDKIVEGGEGIPLPEAELVVSAGRGLKGPDNWGIVEELAGALGAATACSRPVADIGWRPHHEHVGQTGIAIRPNLYIAAGISGAIQHLAGVNGSKVIVVINTDPEAPFFKAADYGVVGDAFEVLPRLTDAVKKFKTAD